MKKKVVFILSVFIIISCSTTKSTRAYHINDYNSDNYLEEDLVTVLFEKGIIINKIDNIKINDKLTTFYPGVKHNAIRVPYGFHEFYVSYYITVATGIGTYTAESLGTSIISNTLEKNNSYKITAKINSRENVISYEIIKHDKNVKFVSLDNMGN